ncbi:MAG: type I restriction enzyme HsdR N-terminal domain-containing protein [Actinomyces bowdenii]|nr:type I restriction enzyme HsdR N-terminal domain-containing protein [Actinomyces bowdenii]
MSFENALADIANRTRDYADSLETEEATKTAIIMPFIQGVLGYDVFNPDEVIPEFVADVGSRKGEKIDYAIKQDDKIQILIEAKKIGEPLSLEHASQLVRYFSVSNDARIGILTNGRYWDFYTDLDKPNILDSKPFLRLDLLNIDHYTLPELKKLTKSTFDLGSVLTAAEELKYVSSTRSEIARAFNSPDPDFVQLFARRVYDGALTARMRDFFQNVVEKACRQFLAEQVNERLKNALSESSPIASSPSEADQTTTEERKEKEGRPGIVTTEEEREAYFIVRAIVASEIPVDRIFERDTKSYFTVLVDDTNRKPVCRFHFNSKSKKYLGIIGPDKSETRYLLERLEDIYDHADALRETVKRYT